VGLATDKGHPYTGTLNFINNQVDPADRHDQFASRGAESGSPYSPPACTRGCSRRYADLTAILIDDKAVMTDQDRKYVYVVGPENKAVRKDVTLGDFA